MARKNRSDSSDEDDNNHKNDSVRDHVDSYRKDSRSSHLHDRDDDDSDSSGSSDREPKRKRRSEIRSDDKGKERYKPVDDDEDGKDRGRWGNNQEEEEEEDRNVYRNYEDRDRSNRQSRRGNEDQDKVRESRPSPEKRRGSDREPERERRTELRSEERHKRVDHRRRSDDMDGNDRGRYGKREADEDRDRSNGKRRRDNGDNIKESRPSPEDYERKRRSRDQYDRDDRLGSERKRDRRGYDDDTEVKERGKGDDGQSTRLEPIVNSTARERPIGEVNAGRSGGVYVPPFKLARMMRDVEDKSSAEYQRLTWDALRKSINGLVNKVNATNIKNIIPELFSENLIRGKGLFCRSCMKSQMASPGFTDVFAGLVAVVNTKFPEVGELLLRRIVLQLKRAYKRNDKPQLLAAVKFVAHLVNQQVAHEIISLELLTVLLENPSDDSVEVAVGFVTECGSILQDLSPKGLHGIFARFRGILHEGEIDKRVQFMIEGLFAIRKAKFQGYPAVRPELDLVDQEDQLTHEISLKEEIDPEITLDLFKPDPNFLENEKRYEDVRRSILGEESEDEEASDAASDGEDKDEEDSDDDESEEAYDEEQMQIRDETETNLVNLRRTIYLTIMSSVDFEEAGHKLLKIKLEPGQEMELCIMLLECCSQERTYLKYYGLLGQRFCMINKVHQENFEKSFVQQYSMIHRLETNKLRNVGKFFAHLLGTFALPWHVFAYIRLTEEDTTSSSRIFIKILFQELSEHLGIRLLNEKLSDPTMQGSFESIFPKDNPKNTRFAINFFTSIGLGGITENLREYLKNLPLMIMQQQKPEPESESESESDGSDSSSSGSSESESESSSSESEKEEKPKKKRSRR